MSYYGSTFDVKAALIPIGSGLPAIIAAFPNAISIGKFPCLFNVSGTFGNFEEQTLLIYNNQLQTAGDSTINSTSSGYKSLPTVVITSSVYTGLTLVDTIKSVFDSEYNIYMNTDLYNTLYFYKEDYCCVVSISGATPILTWFYIPGGGELTYSAYPFQLIVMGSTFYPTHIWSYIPVLNTAAASCSYLSSLAYSSNSFSNNFRTGNASSQTLSTNPSIAALFETDFEPEPIDPPDVDTDPYSGIDGQGTLPDGQDVDLPAEPTLSASDAGLFALFSPSASQMRSLASFLWTDFGGTGTDVVQVLGEVVEALKRTVSNPLNSMLGLSIIASQGLSKGSSSNVHVGFWDTGVSMTKLAKQYFTVDCGSISFNPVCGDTFLDYAPYSKFSIFLPYVGTKELDANDVVGHTLSVKYRGDCVTGSLVCYLKRDGTIIAEFAGNCALNLPLTADSWGATLSGAGAIVAGGVRGAVTGGATAAGGAVKAAASVATNPSVFSSQVTYTGAVSGGAGHMGSQKPFILREAVRFHSTSHFNSVIGYPAFYYRKLGDCSGYTQVLDVHLHNTPCTGVELKEIEDLLKEGVII